MKFNWDIHSDNMFCLNPVLCNLKLVNKSPVNKIQCFSFNKGKRTLVYVKINDKYKSLDDNISLSNQPKQCPSGKVLKVIKIERCVLNTNTKTDIQKIELLKYKKENKILKETIKNIKVNISLNKIKIDNMKEIIKKLTSKSKILILRNEINDLMKKNKSFKNDILEYINKINYNNNKIKN